LNKKLEAQDYIGERRLRIIDRRWSGNTATQARTLEDTGATIEDLDLQGENEMLFWRRSRPTSTATPNPQGPTAPSTPGADPR
jgi:hypothetical protein